MRKPSLKPSSLSREELLERRVSDLERMVRRLPVRHVAGGASDTTFVVNKTSHGLAVMDVVQHNGTDWTKSQADTAANAVVGGMVIAVLSPDVFVVATPGSYVSGLSGLTAGAVHYLDASTAGALTTTAPSIAVSVIHADSSSSGVLMAAQAITATRSIVSANLTWGSGTSAISISPLSLEVGDTFTLDIHWTAKGVFGSQGYLTYLRAHCRGTIDSATTWSGKAVLSSFGLGQPSSGAWVQNTTEDAQSVSAVTTALTLTAAGVVSTGSGPVTSTGTITILPDLSASPCTGIKLYYGSTLFTNFAHSGRAIISQMS